MKRILVFSAALAAGFFIARCNGVASHVNAVPCRNTSDCGLAQYCSQSYCHYPDGGLVIRPDGGPPGNDAGNPDDDSGTPCVNLQCQQVRCVSGSTTLTGTVYDPRGPGPDGDGGVFLFNALVYVPNGTVQPFTPGVSCDRCAAASGSPLVSTSTGADGKFTLSNVPVGTNIPLVIQIGRWRRQVSVNVPACSTTVLPASLTRLPRNKTEGDIPKMAIATGNADPFECLLRKIGIDDAEITRPSGGGRVHYYVKNGIDMNPPAPAADTLWNDFNLMKTYDIIMLPCEGFEDPKPSPQLQNIVNYTTLGGRVFATHFSYVWMAINGVGPFAATGDWQTNQAYPPQGSTYVFDTSFPKGQAFVQWLWNVAATPDAGQISIFDPRHDINSVTAKAQQWIYWDGGGSAPPNSVAHLTFNTPLDAGVPPDGGIPLQCGRVVFSDFHVSANALDTSQPYFPASCKNEAPSGQEKALEFMLFDLSSCVQDDRLPIIR